MLSDNLIKDFPILNVKENGQRLIYLDNAATTQKPLSVIDAISNYYKGANANPHRGVYELAGKATDIYENARKNVAKFINASSFDNIIFTKNTTESLNLIAYSYGMHNIKENDEILIAISEHHANLIPWQQIAKHKKAVLKYIYFNEDGLYTNEEIDKKINERTKIVSIAVVSNVLGTYNPISYLLKKAKSVGAVTILDAAQSIAHLNTDVKELDPDFMVFSGHKMYAPMGIGVLYAKTDLLNSIPPFLTGGDMILSVHEQESSFAKAPRRFEAGTQNVEGAYGLNIAIDYIDKLGLNNIMEHEHDLINYTFEYLHDMPYVQIYGNTSDLSLRSGIIAFNIDDIHPHDVATIMDNSGVAIRAGHHCAQPLMEYLKIHSCCRLSFGIYNTKEDVDIFIEAIKNVRRIFGYGS